LIKCALQRYYNSIAQKEVVNKLARSGVDRYIVNIGTKKLLKIVLAIQLTVIGLIWFNYIGIQIPIIRQVICFIYLAFMPGILILRILKIDELNFTETILLSMGLSLSFIMFTGALFNSLCLLIGISKPISEMPLIAFISAMVLLLCTVTYLRCGESYSDHSFDLKNLFSHSILFSILLPFIAVLGAHLLRVHDSNLLLLSLLSIISIVPLLVGFDKLPEKAYTAVIWAVAFSLLSHISLTQTNSLREAVVPGVVITEGAWISHLPSPQNALLSNTILHPIFSIILDLDIIWNIRIVNSLLFAFIPLVMYYAFKTFIDKKTAFLSSFLFMSLYLFYFMSFSIRTGFAMLFLALLFLVSVNEKVSRLNKSILSIVFAFSIITSHYGTSYMFLFSLIFALLLVLLGKKLGYWGYSTTNLTSVTFVPLYIVLALSWYLYVAGSSNFKWIVNFGEHVITSMEDFLSPESSTVIETLTIRQLPFSIQIIKYFLLIIAVSIAIGVLVSIYKRLLIKKSNIPDEYLVFSMAFIGTALTAFLPVGDQSCIRPFFIFLIVLAPFCLIGFESVIDNLTRYFIGSNSNKSNEKQIFTFFSLFLFIFFILNSGIVSEIITKGADYSPNILIGEKRIKECNNIYAKGYFYKELYIPIHDIYCRDWIIYYMNDNKIYCDQIVYHGRFRFVNLERRCKGEKNIPVKVLDKDSQLDGYIVLGYHNLMDGVIFQKDVRDSFSTSELQVNYKNKIYSNGGATIYR